MRPKKRNLMLSPMLFLTLILFILGHNTINCPIFQLKPDLHPTAGEGPVQTSSSSGMEREEGGVGELFPRPYWRGIMG